MLETTTDLFEDVLIYTISELNTCIVLHTEVITCIVI